MGFLDGLFGRGEQREQQRAPRSEDERALERYRYLLRTAPPETIEQVHAEAFARLTPDQRRMALQDLAQYVPEHERATSDDPRTLARAATRAELRQPGTLERAFGGGFGGGGGMGFGGSFASSLLGTVAGYAIASTIANQFFYDHGDAFADGSDADQGGGWETHDAGSDSGGDFDAGGDFGGDFGGDVL
jgi:hypothetical protein